MRSLSAGDLVWHHRSYGHGSNCKNKSKIWPPIPICTANHLDSLYPFSRFAAARVKSKWITSLLCSKSSTGFSVFPALKPKSYSSQHVCAQPLGHEGLISDSPLLIVLQPHSISDCPQARQACFFLVACTLPCPLPEISHHVSSLYMLSLTFFKSYSFNKYLPSKTMCWMLS